MGESLKTYRSLPDGQEYQIPNRVFHQPVFPRKSGRARLQAIPLPVLSSQRGPSLRLMTVRSEGQFNSVVYEETDLYRGQERRDVVLLHPNDMRKLGLKQDQVVTVKSNTGQLTRIHARPFNVREGNALMYYPEANALCPREVDPESRTPAFKNVSITVFPSGTIPC